MNRTKHHLGVADLERAAKPTPQPPDDGRAFNVRQPVAIGPDERRRLVRGAPASLEHQRDQLTAPRRIAGALDRNHLRCREPVLVSSSVPARDVVAVFAGHAPVHMDKAALGRVADGEVKACFLEPTSGRVDPVPRRHPLLRRSRAACEGFVGSGMPVAELVVAGVPGAAHTALERVPSVRVQQFPT